MSGHTKIYRSRFRNVVNFNFARLEGSTYLTNSKFAVGLDFAGTRFLGDAELAPEFKTSRSKQFVSFLECRFAESLQLASNDPGQLLFGGVTLIFRQVDLHKPNQVVFRHVDLSQAYFERTRVKQVNFIDVRWPECNKITTVADQLLGPNENNVWGTDASVWHVLSELKQNYADNGDHQTSGNFQYSAMDLRRRSDDTPWSEKFFLSAYWATSGYGERYARPLVWVGGLALLSTALYAFIGLEPKPSAGFVELDASTLYGWLNALHFSLQATFLRSSEDLFAAGPAGLVQTIQNVASPVFLGLFALALRQRLRR